jgi:hypothetical protein
MSSQNLRSRRKEKLTGFLGAQTRSELISAPAARKGMWSIFWARVIDRLPRRENTWLRILWRVFQVGDCWARL